MDQNLKLSKRCHVSCLLNCVQNILLNKLAKYCQPQAQAKYKEVKVEHIVYLFTLLRARNRCSGKKASLKSFDSISCKYNPAAGYVGKKGRTFNMV